MAESIMHGNVNDAVRLENIIESEVMGSYDPVAEDLQNIDDSTSYKRSKRGGHAVSSDVVAGVIGASSGAASGAASAVNLVFNSKSRKFF